jgi:pimeloyl-ACP methyl ester carboxylesterase
MSALLDLNTEISQIKAHMEADNLDGAADALSAMLIRMSESGIRKFEPDRIIILATMVRHRDAASRSTETREESKVARNGIIVQFDHIIERVLRTVRGTTVGDSGGISGTGPIAGPSETEEPSKPTTLAKDFVVLIHGIRTLASWQSEVCAVVERQGMTAIAIKYGYFDLFRFIFPFWTRDAPVRRIIRELQDVAARAETVGARVSVVAHSFGSYAFARALREPRQKYHRVIFCGSIIPESFRVAEFESKFGNEPILNVCGLGDRWPIIAKSITWGYGATGRFGFGTDRVIDRFHDVGHSGFLNADFVGEHWMPFLRDGKLPDGVAANPPSYALLVATWVPWKFFIWVLPIVAGILAIDRWYN